ncbi:MAG: thermonuclease family protein [Rhodobacteraceae bacterium]|nr:thermonuclease family protein [Paracoccaceae bacterium]
MTRRGRNVVPFSRDYRRPPRWNMGLPPRRPQRPPADPRRYLGLAMLAGVAGLIVLPAVADALGGVVKRLAPEAEGCRVVQVIDGDTVTLWCAGRGAARARLTGYDTPELFEPACLSELWRAWQAKWQLRRELWTAGEVTVIRSGTDRYGRALAAVFVDGENVARRMIAAGNARPYGGGQRQGWCGA